MRASLRTTVALAAVLSLSPGPARGARADTQELTFRSAPVTVAAYGVAQSYQLIPSPGEDGYVVGISADVVDGNGASEPIAHVMLHHIVFAKIGAPDPTCARFIRYDGRSFPFDLQRFYAEGEERTSIRMPPGYGYPNKAIDHWAMVFMLMNHRSSAKTVTVQYTVRYVTGETLTPVTPYWFDVENCRADPIFSVPGDGPRFSTFSRSSDFVMPESGSFVAGGAHLHGGGVRLTLANQTCGSPAFTSEPTWGLPLVRPVMHEPGPKHMTTFSAAGGIPVTAGDRLRLTAVYDDSRPHTRVMGIMVLYLAPGTVPHCGPAPALPSDPLSDPGAPPGVTLPLLKRPTGPVQPVLSTFVRDFRFGQQRVFVKVGSTFRWTFQGPDRHNVTLASGPVGFASPSIASGDFSFRFTRTGTYRLFCSLHPTLMTQIVTVG